MSQVKVKNGIAKHILGLFLTVAGTSVVLEATTTPVHAAASATVLSNFNTDSDIKDTVHGMYTRQFKAETTRHKDRVPILLEPKVSLKRTDQTIGRMLSNLHKVITKKIHADDRPEALKRLNGLLEVVRNVKDNDNEKVASAFAAHIFYYLPEMIENYKENSGSINDEDKIFLHALQEIQTAWYTSISAIATRMILDQANEQGSAKKGDAESTLSKQTQRYESKKNNREASAAAKIEELEQKLRVEIAEIEGVAAEKLELLSAREKEQTDKKEREGASKATISVADNAIAAIAREKAVAESLKKQDLEAKRKTHETAVARIKAELESKKAQLARKFEKDLPTKKEQTVKDIETELTMKNSHFAWAYSEFGTGWTSIPGVKTLKSWTYGNRESDIKTFASLEEGIDKYIPDASALMIDALLNHSDSKGRTTLDILMSKERSDRTRIQRIYTLFEILRLDYETVNTAADHMLQDLREEEAERAEATARVEAGARAMSTTRSSGPSSSSSSSPSCSSDRTAATTAARVAEQRQWKGKGRQKKNLHR